MSCLRPAAPAILIVSLLLSGVDAAPARAGEVKSGNTNTLQMYGILTRGLLYADDGEDKELFHIDGGIENSRLGWIVEGQLSEKIAVGGHIEMDLPLSSPQGNATLTANGPVTGDDTAWAIRIFDIAFATPFGRFSIGQGDTASTDRVFVNLSGSDLANRNSPADMAGGINFYDRSTGTRTVTLAGAFDALDGIDKEDRVRYDLPEIGGLAISTSMTQGQGWDVGAGYAMEGGGFEFEAGAFYANISGTSTTDEDMFGGSASIKHQSGLSATFAGAVKNLKGAGRDASDYAWGNLGYSADALSLGQTHVSVSYGVYNDFAQNGDEATHYGIGVVQDFDFIGSNFWLLVRNHELDRSSGGNFDDVLIINTGLLINF